MNITIKLDVSRPPQKAKKKSILERVEYAVDCIDIDLNKKKAIDFLQHVRVFLEEKMHLSDEEKAALEKTNRALNPYGYTKHLGEDK